MARELLVRRAMRFLPLALLALSLVTFGCGGVSESGSPTNGPSGPNKEESTPTKNETPTTPRTPQKVGSPKAPSNVAVPYQILVSNQSFDIDPVDIDVYIDGVHVIAGDFVVGSQHTWIPFDFDVATGEHTLRVVSKKGTAEKTATFKLNGTKRWTVVMFWFYEKPRGGAEADEKPFFSIETYDEEPKFA